MYAAMFLLLLLLPSIDGISIPFINNVILQPLPYVNLNSTIRLNSSCEKCLCEQFNSTYNRSDLALNCFSNQTCQFFRTFPIGYKIQSSTGSRLYFLQNQFPSASQCCMPNITELLLRLQSVSPIVMNLTFKPAAFGYDETNPNEAAVTGWGSSILYFFNPITMAYLRNFTIPASYFLTLRNNQTFTASSGTLVSIRNSQTNTILATINYTSLTSVRKIIYLNNGTTAVFSTQDNNSLTFFDVNSPTNYTIQKFIPFPFPAAHGIAKVNDTFLYASSWTNRSIVSYRFENSSWKMNYFVNDSQSSSGSFISTDDCGRVWFVNINFGLHIYDSSGVRIASWNMTLASTDGKYDFLLLPNYIFLVSHYDQYKIIRYDPELSCS